MMAVVTVSAILLRWLPYHGMPILALFALAVASAATIYFTQRRRYRTSSHGIAHERVEADVHAILWTAAATAALGALGITVILTA